MQSYEVLLDNPFGVMSSIGGAILTAYRVSVLVKSTVSMDISLKARRRERGLVFRTVRTIARLSNLV